MLTAGGLAPCLSSAVGGLIERYTAVAPEVHEPMSECVDAIDCAHHDRHRFDGFEDRQRAPEKVGITGRVDDIEVRGVAVEAADAGVEGMLQPFLLRVEVGDRTAALQVTLTTDHAGLQQQRFQQ